MPAGLPPPKKPPLPTFGYMPPAQQNPGPNLAQGVFSAQKPVAMPGQSVPGIGVGSGASRFGTGGVSKSQASIAPAMMSGTNVGNAQRSMGTATGSQSTGQNQGFSKTPDIFSQLGQRLSQSDIGFNSGPTTQRVKEQTPLSAVQSGYLGSGNGPDLFSQWRLQGGAVKPQEIAPVASTPIYSGNSAIPEDDNSKAPNLTDSTHVQAPVQQPAQNNSNSGGSGIETSGAGLKANTGIETSGSALEAANPGGVVGEDNGPTELGKETKVRWAGSGRDQIDSAGHRYTDIPDEYGKGMDAYKDELGNTYVLSEDGQYMKRIDPRKGYDPYTGKAEVGWKGEPGQVPVEGTKWHNSENGIDWIMKNGSWQRMVAEDKVDPVVKARDESMKALDAMRAIKTPTLTEEEKNLQLARNEQNLRNEAAIRARALMSSGGFTDAAQQAGMMAEVGSKEAANIASEQNNLSNQFLEQDYNARLADTQNELSYWKSVLALAQTSEERAAALAQIQTLNSQAQQNQMEMARFQRQLNKLTPQEKWEQLGMGALQGLIGSAGNAAGYAMGGLFGKGS